MFRRLSYRIREYLSRPIVVIRRSGQLTDKPKVNVSVARLYSSQGVYTWEDTPQGNACAEMYGKNLAEIVRASLVDQRKGDS